MTDYSYGELQLYNNQETYVMNIEEYSSDPRLWELQLVINGSEKYTYRDLIKENKLEPTTNKVSDDAIYFYMMQLYRQLTMKF